MNPFVWKARQQEIAPRFLFHERSRRVGLCPALRIAHTETQGTRLDEVSVFGHFAGTQQLLDGPSTSRLEQAKVIVAVGNRIEQIPKRAPAHEYR